MNTFQSEPLLRMRNITIRRGDNFILHEAYFELQNGEFVYIIGKVGSGKTTFLEALYCEAPIERGWAQVMDFNLLKIRSKEIPYLRRKLGIVFQDFQLLMDRTVYSNLGFVLEATGWRDRARIEERIEEVLFQVGMQNKGY
ncbi:MAG: ATP-binding cassette domain-containing protein, partial [Tannerellaceae bacterium]|nr:ATP-binding cassette domain-containing protein [Tannerellaceae bacterium]